jgi:methionine aminotransferase
MQIISKLPDVGLTIFTTMSKMAVDYQAINLGQGFPDFNTDPKLQALVSKAMADGFNQYPYMTGIAELRNVISEKVETLYGRHYNVDTEITVTSGATQAIMAILLASVGPDDEVIVLEPCYDCYLPAIKLASAKAVCIPMQAPTQEKQTFHVDWAQVQSTITTRTRMIIINFPHNPTGAIMSKSDLDKLELVVQNTNIMILSDEVYEHIIFDDVQHLSVATRPALAERSFVVSSFGKTTHTTGWKIGYVCAPKEMTVELRKVHQFMVFTVPSVLQHGLAAYTKDASTYLNLPAFYQSKRDRLTKGLLQTKFKVLPSPGTFFLLADYSDISDISETEFSIWLTKKHGVTVIPVSAFYADPAASASNHKIVRFCFAKKEETLDRAVDRLLNI